MLANNRERLELGHSLLLTLPGTPVLRYGDGIGMGENLSPHERESIRTPVQWDSSRNTGFSSAPMEKLILPLLRKGEFSYEKVNVAAQQRDANSFLNWVARMIRLRLRSSAFGVGQCEWLETSDPAVLAHACSAGQSCVFAIHNLSGRELDVSVALGRKVIGILDLLQDCPYPMAEGARQQFSTQTLRILWLRGARSRKHGPSLLDEKQTLVPSAQRLDEQIRTASK
jgi:maltose alpha-D-glucosyltransferase/alpha-amylase